jgi:hypothetical protein
MQHYPPSYPYNQPPPPPPYSTQQEMMGDVPPGGVSAQPVDYFEITPSCMYKCFMMPFPFLCIGCCLSQSTKMKFDNTQRILTLKTYCGYCCCCSEERIIPYHEVQSLDARPNPHVTINRRTAYNVWLVWQTGQIELTASMVLS